MLIFFIFIFLLLLENLFLPALIGPGPFIITQIFILALIIYGGSWRKILLWAVPMILIEELFTGAGTGNLILPFLITSVIFMIMNRFFNIADNLRESSSLPGLAVSIIMLGLASYAYSWFFILHNTASYDFGLVWNYWKSFISASIFSTIAWSAAISIIFKFILYRK